MPRTKKIKTPSAIPVYGVAAVWALWCLILPVYKLSHILMLAGVSLIVFAVLNKLFPGTVTEVEIPPEPVTTGDPEVDRLLREGDAAVAELRRLEKAIDNKAVAGKVTQIREVTEKIFKDIIDDPNDAPQVRRFAGYYLPTTLKLLKAYEKMGSGEVVEGTNVAGTLGKIESVLDTTLEAYKKQYDALFMDQALDIETDITVLEAMLKREGLTGKDFDVDIPDSPGGIELKF